MAGCAHRGTSAFSDNAADTAAHDTAHHGDVVYGIDRDTRVPRVLEIGMSRTRFSERFKALAGIPPLDYLIGWRTSVAKAGLTHGQKSIVPLAEEIGYGSESAFSSAFKQPTRLRSARLQVKQRR